MTSIHNTKIAKIFRADPAIIAVGSQSDDLCYYLRNGKKCVDRCLKLMLKEMRRRSLKGKIEWFEIDLLLRKILTPIPIAASSLNFRPNIPKPSEVILKAHAFNPVKQKK